MTEIDKKLTELTSRADDAMLLLNNIKALVMDAQGNVPVMMLKLKISDIEHELDCISGLTSSMYQAVDSINNLIV